ncbi:MAG: YegP family protein [Anaerolineales bacterium]
MAGKFILRKSKRGFSFNLVASNGQVILTSEAYTSRAGAMNGIAAVQKNATNAAAFDKRTAKDGSPYFVLVAANQEPIGRSEMYSSTSARSKGIASVMKQTSGAVIDDQTSA